MSATQTIIVAPLEEALGAHTLSINQKCRNCRHLTGEPALGHAGKTCAALGIIADSRPCAKFSPDPLALAKNFSMKTMQLLEELSSANPSTLALAAAVLNSAAHTSKLPRDLRIGQRVWLEFGEGVGISRWREAQIVDVNSTKRLVLIVYPFVPEEGAYEKYAEQCIKTRTSPFRMTVSPETVKTRTEFGKVLEQLGLRNFVCTEEEDEDAALMLEVKRVRIRKEPPLVGPVKAVKPPISIVRPNRPKLPLKPLKQTNAAAKRPIVLIPLKKHG